MPRPQHSEPQSGSPQQPPDHARPQRALRPLRALRLAAVLAALGVLASACGGDGEGFWASREHADPPDLDLPVDPAAEPPDPSPAPATEVDADDVPAEGAVELVPDAYEPATAFEAVALGIEEDGTVPKDVALQAFALAYGPLPGVDVPEGEAGMHSGTAARMWISRYYDELTPEQRDAVDAALLPLDAQGRPPEMWDVAEDGERPTTGTTGGAPSDAAAGTHEIQLIGTGPRGTVTFRQALEFVPSCWNGLAVKGDAPGVEPYRQLIDRELALLEPRLGPLGIPIYLSYGRSTALADATAESDDCTKPASWCAIRIHPALASDRTGREARATIAHELVHCYQGRVVPISTFQDWAGSASWLVEGFAEFAANSVHPHESPSSAAFLAQYYDTPATRLLQRSYDAAGFFHHVASSGGDPFATFASAMRASDPMAAFTAHVGASRSGFSETWASAMARDATRGTAWDERAPEVPDHTPSVATTTVGNDDVFILGAPPAGTNLHYAPLASDVLIIEVEGESLGRISWDGTSDESLTSAEGEYCLRPGGCECPQDKGPPPPPDAPSQAAMVAVNGIDGSSLVQLTGMSLADWCRPVDPCLVGTWVTQEWVSPGPIPEMDQVGGAGAIVHVEEDGTIGWDFDSMDPLVSYDEFIDTTFAAVSEGQAAGTVVARDGEWSVEADLSGVSGRVLTDGPFPEAEAAAGPASIVLASDGSYICEGDDRFSYSTPDPVLPGIVVGITLVRAG